MLSKLVIRPEIAADIPTISLIHTRAFGYRVAEACIVDFHRHNPRFDPKFSLVAEWDGEVVGHALFSPHSLQLLGETVNALNLAPISIDPAWQKRGIGGALLEEGHRLARANNYALIFLLGHPDYYPRFGYQTYAYGAGGIRVHVGNLPQTAHLQTRSLNEADIPTLVELWWHEERQVDFSTFPGASILDWISPHPAMHARIFERDGVIMGYGRGDMTHPMLFLARDHITAHEMAHFFADGFPDIELPLHPYSFSARAFQGMPTLHVWDAAMALALAPSPFDDYYAAMRAGYRPPGRPIWSVAFDV